MSVFSTSGFAIPYIYASTATYPLYCWPTPKAQEPVISTDEYNRQYLNEKHLDHLKRRNQQEAAKVKPSNLIAGLVNHSLFKPNKLE